MDYFNIQSILSLYSINIKSIFISCIFEIDSMEKNHVMDISEFNIFPGLVNIHYESTISTVNSLKTQF